MQTDKMIKSKKRLNLKNVALLFKINLKSSFLNIGAIVCGMLYIGFTAMFSALIVFASDVPDNLNTTMFGVLEHCISGFMLMLTITMLMVHLYKKQITNGIINIELRAGVKPWVTYLIRYAIIVIVIFTYITIALLINVIFSTMVEMPTLLKKSYLINRQAIFYLEALIAISLFIFVSAYATVAIGTLNMILTAVLISLAPLISGIIPIMTMSSDGSATEVAYVFRNSENFYTKFKKNKFATDTLNVFGTSSNKNEIKYLFLGQDKPTYQNSTQLYKNNALFSYFEDRDGGSLAYVYYMLQSGMIGISDKNVLSKMFGISDNNMQDNKLEERMENNSFISYIRQLYSELSKINYESTEVSKINENIMQQNNSTEYGKQEIEKLSLKGLSNALNSVIKLGTDEKEFINYVINTALKMQDAVLLLNETSTSHRFRPNGSYGLATSENSDSIYPLKSTYWVDYNSVKNKNNEHGGADQQKAEQDFLKYYEMPDFQLFAWAASTLYATQYFLPTLGVPTKGDDPETYDIYDVIQDSMKNGFIYSILNIFNEVNILSSEKTDDGLLNDVMTMGKAGFVTPSSYATYSEATKRFFPIAIRKQKYSSLEYYARDVELTERSIYANDGVSMENHGFISKTGIIVWWFVIIIGIGTAGYFLFVRYSKV